MKKAMIITVGTGLGVDEKKSTESLAHGIVKSIKTNNPSYIVFFVTEESKKKTIPRIKEQYQEIPDFRLAVIKDMTDVSSIYEQAFQIVKELKGEGYEVTIDFTSGTKAMSAGVVLAGIKEFCTLSYVSGKRGENNVVIKGTERVMTSEPVETFVDLEEDIIRKMFNSHQYEPGLSILSGIRELTSDSKVVERLNRYEQFLNGYSKWDKFNHKGALEMLRTFDNSLVNIDKNKSFLLNWKEEFLIPDLLNNAKRRIEEGKYDDAVARLYRCIEMIAQYRLKKDYNLDTSKIHIIDLRSKPIEDIEKYEKKQDNEGVIKLALKEDYELLKDLNDELGEVMDDKGFVDILHRRNVSILAHGVIPIKKEDAERLFDKTKKTASMVVKDLDELMGKSKFPRL